MSDGFEALKNHTAKLEAIAEGARDVALEIAHFRAELERTRQLLRRLNKAHRPLSLPLAGALAFLVGLLGSLVAGGTAMAYLYLGR